MHSIRKIKTSSLDKMAFMLASSDTTCRSNLNEILKIGKKKNKIMDHKYIHKLPHILHPFSNLKF